MNKKNLLFLPLSVMSLAFVTSCNPGSEKLTDAEKVNKVANAAITKVNEFNSVIKNAYDPKIKPSEVANAENTAYYYEPNKYNFCEDQAFTLYIFNNIYYAMNYYYSGNDTPVELGKVIKGTTRNLPDKRLQKIYDDDKTIKDSTLAFKCELSGDDNNYIVKFEADWNFRDEKLKTHVPYMYSVIETTGEVSYSKESGLQYINLNYYFSDDYRIFASSNLDFVNNKFTFMSFSKEDESGTMSWDWQAGGKDDKFLDAWNSGNFKPDDIRKYQYNFVYAYEGDISTDLEKLNLKSFYRYVEEYPEKGTVLTEDQTRKSDWETLFNDVYKVNKKVKVRGDNDLLDLTNAIDKDVDSVVKYGAGKTRLYWIYDDKKSSNESINYKKAILPFEEKENLIKYLNTIDSTKLSDDQNKLLVNTIDYLNKLDKKDFLGEFETPEIKYMYKTDGEIIEEYRFNVYIVKELQYQIINNKNPDIVIKFIIDEGKLKLNESFK